MANTKGLGKGLGALLGGRACRQQQNSDAARRNGGGKGRTKGSGTGGAEERADHGPPSVTKKLNTAFTTC